MRFCLFLIGLSIGLQSVCILPALADERFTLNVYLVFVEDVCPGGYQQVERCPIFTAARFEDLKRRGRLRGLGVFRDIIPLGASNGSVESVIELGQEGMSLARHCGSSSHLAALLVVEWLGIQGTGAQGRATAKSGNRRSFDHGSLCNLDPEQSSRWTFSRHGTTLSIVFQ
jgi:hypothetical protein